MPYRTSKAGKTRGTTSIGAQTHTLSTQRPKRLHFPVTVEIRVSYCCFGEPAPRPVKRRLLCCLTPPDSSLQDPSPPFSGSLRFFIGADYSTMFFRCQSLSKKFFPAIFRAKILFSISARKSRFRKKGKKSGLAAHFFRSCPLIPPGSYWLQTLFPAL